MLDLEDKRVNGPTIRLNSGDNVAVALREIASGTALPDSNVVTRDIVPAGYKVAVRTRPLPGVACPGSSR